MAFKLLPEQKKENAPLSESLHRLPSQALKGSAAALPGIFGDVLSLPYAGVNKAVSALGGKDVPYEQSPLGKIIPTTQTHLKNLEEGIPYLKPKNKIESFVSDIASDATSLALPGGALTKAGLRGTGPVKSFLTSVGANSAGSFVTDLTGDPDKGAYTKMGAMFLFSALNKPGAQKEIGKLYEKADSLLPEGATVNARRLQSDMKGLKKWVLNGRTTKDLALSEKFVVDEANKILRQIDGQEANVGTLKSALRSLNENLTKMIYESPDKATKVRARSLAKGINQSINKTLADYGKTNPEWWKYQKGANQAFGAIQQSNFVSNFIKENVAANPITHGLLHAFGIATGAAGAIVPYQAGKIIYRMSKSPQLAKHYARVVSSAAAENAPVMNKELKRLDKELQEEEKNNTKKFRLLE